MHAVREGLRGRESSHVDSASGRLPGERALPLLKNAEAEHRAVLEARRRGVSLGRRDTPASRAGVRRPLVS